MANPPRSPTKLNTPRNRALDIGTDRSGFPDGIPYDAVAGTPSDKAGGRYESNVKRDGNALPSVPPRPAADPKSIK